MAPRYRLTLWCALGLLAGAQYKCLSYSYNLQLPLVAVSAVTVVYMIKMLKLMEAKSLSESRTTLTTYCAVLATAASEFLSAVHTYTHTYRFLSGCKEVENCTSQLVKPRNFPQPRNITLLQAFYLATTQILEYTPTQRLPTRTCTLTTEQGFN